MREVWSKANGGFAPSGVNRENRLPLKVTPNFRVDAAPPLKGWSWVLVQAPKPQSPLLLPFT